MEEPRRIAAEPRAAPARRGGDEPISRAYRAADAYLLRRPGLLREAAEAVHKRARLDISHGRPGRYRAAVPFGAHSAGARLPERQGVERRGDLVSIRRVQSFPRRR